MTSDRDREFEAALRALAKDQGWDLHTDEELGGLGRALIDYFVLRLHDREGTNFRKV